MIIGTEWTTEHMGKEGGRFRCVPGLHVCTHVHTCVYIHVHTHPFIWSHPEPVTGTVTVLNFNASSPSFFKKLCCSCLPRKFFLFSESLLLHFHLSQLELHSFSGCLGIKHSAPGNGLCTGLKHTATAQLVINTLGSCVCDIEKTKKRHLFPLWFCFVLFFVFWFFWLVFCFVSEWDLKCKLAPKFPQRHTKPGVSSRWRRERHRCPGI